jgi:DNA repair protein RecN (Recombination protein N)
VSGSTAERVGAAMKALSKRQQVLTITHLPQVAAYGDQHWKVEKIQSDTTTNTSVTSLNDSERVQEVARMLSGALITNAALKQAEVLLYRD